MIGSKKYHCKNALNFGRLNYCYKSTYLQAVTEDIVWFMIKYLLFIILNDLGLIFVVAQTEFHI